MKIIDWNKSQNYALYIPIRSLVFIIKIKFHNISTHALLLRFEQKYWLSSRLNVLNVKL
jgi:hypothetical protein